MSTKDMTQNALLSIVLQMSPKQGMRAASPHTLCSWAPACPIPSVCTSPSGPCEGSPVQVQRSPRYVPRDGKGRIRQRQLTKSIITKSSWVLPLLPPLEPSECRLPWRGDAVSGESGGFTCIRTRQRWAGAGSGHCVPVSANN